MLLLMLYYYLFINMNFIQDLARSLAMNCLIFNCSDDLDFISMGKFFSGVAASGSWACFDEFNRLEVSTDLIDISFFYTSLAIYSDYCQTIFPALEHPWDMNN